MNTFLRQNPFVSFGVIFVSFLAYMSLVKADTERPIILEKPDEVGFIDITVGEWPPFISESQKHFGVIAHVIKDIFADMGFTVRYHFLPWARAYEEAATGRFDGTAVWMHKQEREKDFIYSDPVLTEQFVFFHLKKYEFDWQDVDDLKGVVIGGNHKHSYGPDFDSALEQGEVNMDRVNGYPQNFNRLLANRIQLFPLEKNVGYYILRREFSEKKQSLITHHPKVLLDNFSYILFPKINRENHALILRFNQSLRAFRKSGRYERYMKDMYAGNYDIK